MSSPISQATSPRVKSPRTERQTPHKGAADDLEKIKEDSAESFLEVHNQDGMVLVVPLTHEEKVLKDQTINPIFSHYNMNPATQSVGTQSIVYSNNDEKLTHHDLKDSSHIIKPNPSRVVLSKKQQQSNASFSRVSGPPVLLSPRVSNGDLSQNMDMSGENQGEDGTITFNDLQEAQFRENRYL
jgi:hypothetical protein